MEHKYVIEEGIIEKYLLHRLNERDTDEFEEHLLYCKECRSTLKESKGIMTLTQYMAIHTSEGEIKKVTNGKNVILFRSWMKVAAVLLIVLCSAGIILSLLHKPTFPLVNSENKSNQVNTTPDSVIKNISQPENALSSSVLSGEKELISDNYKELPLYENAIKNNLRGEIFHIVSPELSSKIKFGKKVVFLLKDYDREFLLSVINNSGKNIFEKVVKTPYTLPLDLPQGLYYWEIIENDEVVFVGKFIIR
jgi:hypothetical protein